MTNASFANNITGITDLTTGLNQATSGWFFGLVLLAIWLILLVTMLNRGISIQDGLLSSSFIIGLLAGALLGLGLVAAWVLAFPAIGIAVGIILKRWT